MIAHRWCYERSNKTEKNIQVHLIRMGTYLLITKTAQNRALWKTTVVDVITDTG